MKIIKIAIDVLISYNKSNQKCKKIDYYFYNHSIIYNFSWFFFKKNCLINNLLISLKLSFWCFVEYELKYIFNIILVLFLIINNNFIKINKKIL